MQTQVSTNPSNAKSNEPRQRGIRVDPGQRQDEQTRPRTEPGERRRHRGRRRRRSYPGKAIPRGMGREFTRELRAWLKLLDTAIVGIERTAWSLRGVAEEVTGAWQQTRTDIDEIGDTTARAGRGLVRLTQTGYMLAQVAASYRFYSLRAAFLPRDRARAFLDDLHRTNARRFYRGSTRHGGAFLKIGQILSARPDILPRPWIQELSGLQDAAPPLPFETVERVVQSELGKPLDRLFAEFDPEPLAAASIGQVHRAVTHDGEPVAVKVQRPGIAELVRLDLQSLQIFLSAIRSSLPELDYDTIVSEVRGAVLAELDYVEEATVTSNISRRFAGDTAVVVPVVYPHLSTGKVLTTSFIDGRKITSVLDELEARSETGDLRARSQLSGVLGQLMSGYLKQILIHGEFQADPHPGNLLVTDQDRVAILDFGCSKSLLPGVRESYLDLVRSFLTGDRGRMGELFDRLGFRTRSGKPDTLHAFADAILTEFRKAMASGAFCWPDRESMLEQATELLTALDRDPVVAIPTEFVMIARVFGTLMGLFTRYRPDIAFAEHVLPVIDAAFFAAPPAPAYADGAVG